MEGRRDIRRHWSKLLKINLIHVYLMTRIMIGPKITEEQFIDILCCTVVDKAWERIARGVPRGQFP